MIELDYYPLKKAAEILNCSEDDLIHLGANDNLPIYILAAKYRVTTKHIDSSGASRDYGDRHCRLEKLAVYSLQELEAANQEATVHIEREPFYDYDEGTGKQRLNGYFHFTLEHKNMIYPSFDSLTDWMRQGKNPDDIYPPPLLIKDCALVIRRADLIRLQVEDTQAEPEPDTGAGKIGNKCEGYRENLDLLRKSVNFDELSVEGIYNEAKKTDSVLWSIEFATFQRDVWPNYSKARGITKQSGRRKK